MSNPQAASRLRAAVTRRLPWRLRWLRCLSLRHPRQSVRLVYHTLRNTPQLRSLLLHTFGSAILRDALSACHHAGARPFLAFGTLLGHHRDNGFISHDADIDLGLFAADRDKADDIIQYMVSHGYVLRLSDERELSFYQPHWPTLLVDFFYFYERGAAMVYYDERDRRELMYSFPLAAFEPLVPVRFLGEIDVCVPFDVEAFLTASYGDWRTPRPTFDNVGDHPNLATVNSGSDEHVGR